METFISIISSLGFPIAACLYMAKYVREQTAIYRQDIKDLRKEHKDEIGKVTEALNNNTKAVEKLCLKLEGGVYSGDDNAIQNDTR
jgi:hypothetical protein